MNVATSGRIGRSDAIAFRTVSFRRAQLLRDFLIWIDGRSYGIDAIVFDKDGTLIEVGDLWKGIMSRWVKSMTSNSSSPLLLRDLAKALGIDGNGRLIPNGLAHTGTLAEMRLATRQVLDAHDVGSAQSIVTSAAPILEMFDDSEIEPLGDVRTTLQHLSNHGVGIAVATSDSAGPARRQLALLGVEPLLDVVVCGDDAIEPKPSPQVLNHVSHALGVDALRIAMVGDSDTDMATGRHGGAGLCVGVTGGGGRPSGADVLVETIESITATKAAR